MRNLALAAAIGAAVFFGAGTSARAELVGHWIGGSPDLIETSGFRPAGTHDGVAVGSNSTLLAFSSDLPPGCTGQALDLTAGNVGVSINNSATTDPAYQNTFDDTIHSQFTIAYWAKGFPAGWAPWVTKRGEDGIGWQLRRNSGNPVACFTMRGIDNEDAGGSPTNVNDSPAMWHHFAGVWNQATGTRTLYVDGVLSLVTTNTLGQVMTLASGKHLALGARQTSGTDFDSYFAGLLFDVRLYDHPLTQSEVLDLMPPPVPQGLVGAPGSQKIGLTWTPASGATHYTVWTMNRVTSQVQTDVVAAPPYVKTGLSNGVAYSFKVLATNDAGSSAYGTEINATPALGTAKDILAFSFADLGDATIAGTTITKNVALTTDVTALAPSYTVSPIAVQDSAYPSGSSRNFNTPQHYTVTAEDGSTKVYTVQVIKSAPLTYDFTSGMQGWVQIWPAIADGLMWSGGALVAGDDTSETRFGRSPAFYLNNQGSLTFQLDGGQSPLAAPGVAPSLIPAAAIADGGFGGVALRDVASDTYVLSKRRTGNGGGYQTFGFTAAELAGYANDNKKYTLDYIDYNKGGWGWTNLDNVSIPGTLAPAADFAAFGLFGPATLAGDSFTLFVPYATSVAALAPTYTLSPGATCDKPSGSNQNFSAPVTYTVVSSDLLLTRVYTVTVVVMADPATALIGHWVSGAPNLADSAGVTPVGTHDGLAVGGNAAALAFSADDVPLNFGGSSLDLTIGNVGVMINNSATTDAGYVNTFDEPIRSQFTIAFWAKGLPGQWAPWVSKRGEDSIGWQVRRQSGDSVACMTMRGIANEDGPGSTINVNDSPAKWHHFAGVWDQASGIRSLYVDGVLSHEAYNTVGQMMALATAKHLALGARQTSGTDFDSFLGGRLYDVRLYNQKLFSAQVQTVMTTPTSTQAPEAKIRSFGLPGSPAVITGSNITWSFPIGSDLRALAPTFTLTLGATCDQVSGVTRSFTTPQLYTVTSSDSQVTVYTVTGVIGDTFSVDNILQGWHNRVWDASAGAWADLDPDVSTMPATLNGGIIQPAGANSLFRTGYGAVEANGDRDNHLNTLWLRSPQFTLGGAGDLTVQLSKGTAHTGAPASEAAVPFAALQDGGWMGVILRRASDGAFVLTKTKTEGNSDTWFTMTFTQAELAPYVGVACTLELINSNHGGWGWLSMDNVVLPVGSYSVIDPFTAWLAAHFPALSDKSSGGDPDHDGLSNQQEFAFGLDPGSATSLNPITAPLNKTTGMFTYTRRDPAVSGLTYTVMTSTNLSTWVTDAGASASQTVVATHGDVQTVTVTLSGAPLSAPKLFVRVKAQ